MFRLNNLKTTTVVVMSFLALSSFLTSCNKEDDEKAKPTITIEELGENNSKEVEPGEELHLEAEIEAEYGIAAVEVEIHMEDDESAGWYFDTTYTEYVGLLNTDLHQHIDVPATAAHGDYHVHVEVTDAKGNTVSAEEELHIH